MCENCKVGISGSMTGVGGPMYGGGLTSSQSTPVMGSTEPKKESQIERELKELAESVIRLNSVVPKLVDKLSPVLRSPELKEAGDRPEVTLAELPFAIRIQRYGVQSVVRQIQDVLERLEL